MKALIIALTIALLSLSAFAQEGEQLLQVSSYEVGTDHVVKFIDTEKTQCKDNMCITVDISFISDGLKGKEPGKNRAMFVTTIQYDLSDHSALFLIVAQFNFENDIPVLKAVLGSPERPASSKWVLISKDNPLDKEIEILIKHKKEFEGNEIN